MALRAANQIYRCWSNVVLGNNRRVYVCWFRVDKRRQPIGDYAKLICDYEALDEHQKVIMRDLVDEQFLLDEAEMVREQVLELRGWSVDIREAMLPQRYVLDKAYGRESHGFREYIKLERTPYVAFYKLDEQPGYSLGFRVWGYYNPGD